MERLLIVDDEPGIRMLLKDYFEMTGYETWTAENGREAVELAKKQPGGGALSDFVSYRQDRGAG